MTEKTSTSVCFEFGLIFLNVTRNNQTCKPELESHLWHKCIAVLWTLSAPNYKVIHYITPTDRWRVENWWTAAWMDSERKTSIGRRWLLILHDVMKDKIMQHLREHLKTEVFVRNCHRHADDNYIVLCCSARTAASLPKCSNRGWASLEITLLSVAHFTPFYTYYSSSSSTSSLSLLHSSIPG